MSEIDIRPVSYFELWPRQKLRWFTLLAMLWLLALYLGLRLESALLNPLQTCYLPAYVRTTIYPNFFKPDRFSLLQVRNGSTWETALPASLRDYDGPLKEGVLPNSLPEGLYLRWVPFTPANADLRLFLRTTFFHDRPLFSLTPWSQPCVFFWSCLLALTFPLTILAAILIDIRITKRLRSGVVRSGTRLHARTTFLRSIARWNGVWAPWQLGLTFRVGGPVYLSELALTPFWLLARVAYRVSVFLRGDLSQRRLSWLVAALTASAWLGLYWNVHFLEFDITTPFSDPAMLWVLLTQFVLGLLFSVVTIAIFLPGPFLRLTRAVRPRILGIPADKENHHLLVMGDTGTGKSTLLRQIIRHIQDCADTLVIYDPDGTFASEFYDPARGDVILNPLDRRCPYWQPNTELQDAGEAEALAAGYYPDILKGGGSAQFFSTAARKILAYLFTQRATAADIANWLADPDKLTLLLKNTELKQYVADYAGQMKGGVEATLNAVVNGLRLLPPDRLDPDPTDPSVCLQPRCTWSALTWEKRRQGWIFITNDKMHREALLPLISAWLDNLLLRLMANKPGAHSRNVWFVMDELATLHRLPQLQTGLTETRKHNVRVVLGFQGIAQLQENYGVDAAKVLLSQPATKIFLRTNENTGAEWIEKNLGHQTLEITTKTLNQRTGTSFSKKTERVPLVSLDSIAHLPDMVGYMSHDNFVTRLRLRYTTGVERHLSRIPRSTEPFTPVEPPRGLRPRPLPVGVPASPTPPTAPAPADNADSGTSTNAEPTSLSPDSVPAPRFVLPQTYPGTWLGALAEDWRLEKPVLAKHVANLISGLHPITNEPLPTNGGRRAMQRLDYRFPIVGPIPPDPAAAIPEDALAAHYDSVAAAVHERFPKCDFGEWAAVIIDKDPTRAPDNSTLDLNSYVYVFFLERPQPSPAPQPAAPAQDQPPTPDPPADSTASADLACLSDSVIAATADCPVPSPQSTPIPDPPPTPRSPSASAPDASRCPAASRTCTSPAVIRARRSSVCPACPVPIDEGDLILQTEAGWKHLCCPPSPTNS
jgi:hypothetical protein